MNQGNLAITLKHLGYLRGNAGLHADALAFFEESLSIIRNLAAADPTNADYAVDLFDLLQASGQAQRQLGRHDAAIAFYAEAEELCAEWLARQPLSGEWRDRSHSTIAVIQAMIAAQESQESADAP